MINFVSIFTKQLKEALQIGAKSNLKLSNKIFKNVVISGLGGSGIGGKIVSQLVDNKMSIPVIVNNSYFLPNFVDENSLVIISSYSGNTEETLFAMKEAIKKGAEIGCVTSGGEVFELAKKHNLNHIIVPKGNPPRAMLTYSLVQLFFILENYGLISNTFKNEIETSIELLNKDIENIKGDAKNAASKIKNTIPIIYTDSNYEGVGTRFKQQLNENAKILSFNHVIPEMNHNELVGWAGGSEKYSVLFLRNESDFERNQVRIESSKKIISKYTSNISEIYSKGNSEIEKTLYLILITDWISVYLADIYKVDSIEVDVIIGLKEELSKH